MARAKTQSDMDCQMRQPRTRGPRYHTQRIAVDSDDEDASSVQGAQLGENVSSRQQTVVESLEASKNVKQQSREAPTCRTARKTHSTIWQAQLDPSLCKTRIRPPQKAPVLPWRGHVQGTSIQSPQTTNSTKFEKDGRTQQLHQVNNRTRAAIPSQLGRSVNLSMPVNTVPNKGVHAATIRERHRKRMPKSAHRNLEDLPGEIRNLIYEYLVPQTRVLVKRNYPNKEDADRKKRWLKQHNRLHHPKSRLFHHRETSAASAETLDNARNLMLVNKTFNKEVGSFLFSQTTFCFTSLKVLSAFLNIVPKLHLQDIQKLEVQNRGYGLPDTNVNDLYRDKFGQKWDAVTKAVGKFMPGLKSLEIFAVITDWPCRMAEPHLMPWWQSCLQMAPAQIERVKVSLNHPMIRGNRRAARELSLKLENAMMTAKGQELRDRRETERVYREIESKRLARAERAARKEKARLDALKPAPVLTITSQQIAKQAAIPSKTKQKDLEKFTQWNGLDPVLFY